MVTVYLITNRVTGKYYVGQTSKSLRKRLGDHVRAAGRVPWNKGKRRASWEVSFQG